MSTSLAVIDNMNTDYIPNDNTQHKYVSAHINNISFPKSINELETFIYQNEHYNVEDIINESENGYVIWTVPVSYTHLELSRRISDALSGGAYPVRKTVVREVGELSLIHILSTGITSEGRAASRSSLPAAHEAHMSAPFITSM